MPGYKNKKNKRLSAEPGLKKRLPHFVCADFFSCLNLPTAFILVTIIMRPGIFHKKKNNRRTYIAFINFSKAAMPSGVLL